MFIELALRGKRWDYLLTVPEGEEAPMQVSPNGGPIFEDEYALWLRFGFWWLHQMGGGRMIVFGQR